MSIKNIPQSLIDAVKGIVVDDRAKYFEEEQAREKLVAEKMLSPKQKKIASMAGHPGKIDAADFAALRAGKQVKEASDTPYKPFKYNKKTGTFDRVQPKKMEEEVEQIDEISKETKKDFKARQERLAAASAQTAKDPARLARLSKIPGYTAAMDLAKKTTQKEEVEHLDELSKGTLGSYVRKAAKQAVGAANAAGREEMATGKNSSDNRSLANRRMGGILRATRKMEEERDTPGNGREHQCAVHVKSEQFGEGKTLTTQHADPDEYGNIAWYDVMFEHGIERVMTEDIEILVSEAHTHMKKKGVSAGTTAESRDISTSQRRAHQHNLDAAQREIDRREAEGENMTGARINPKTYEIIKPKKKVM